jgi:putative transport protein
MPFPGAPAALVLALVAGLGLALGSVKVRGVGLSTAGVLFVGLLLGHLGVAVEPEVLEFVRDFGLILFVTSIGLQVGPGFVASLRRSGLTLNLLAAAVVLSGVGLAAAAHLVLGIELPAVVGILSGATTNTPSLAAAQQALQEVARDAAAAAQAATIPPLGYAVAYPFGVAGVILAMLALKLAFRVSTPVEEKLLQRSLRSVAPPLHRANLEVTNPNLDGLLLEKLPFTDRPGLVVSRVHHDGALLVPGPETRLAVGDVLLAVGRRKDLDDLRLLVGKESDLDLTSLPTPITSKRLIVTRKEVVGRTLGELGFAARFGVRITRVSRAELEMGAFPGFELRTGDALLAVGAPEDIRKAAAEVGDSPRDLNYPHLVPVFLTIALGVAVGLFPIHLHGMPAPVKLGLAGGPLLVAILLSRVGRVGPLVFWLPISANFMLREIGIALFLAAVGLRSGAGFVETLVNGPGLTWMAIGAVITLVPILLVGAIARAVFRVNFLTLTGVIAGSMTDPPALAFANGLAGSDAPTLGYVAVYPLTMILRIVSVEVLVLLLAR